MGTRRSQHSHNQNASRQVLPAITTPCDPQAVLALVPAVLAFSLFDHLPDTYLFVKDTQHRFIAVNTALWRLHGCRTADDMIGRDDRDFHPPVLAMQYIAEDQQILQNRLPLIDRLWLVPGADGIPLWYHSSKIPLFDMNSTKSKRHVVGLAGVLRPAQHHGVQHADYARLAPALNYVTKHYAKPQDIRDLAQRANLSCSQLQREFQRLLHLTPSAYIQNVRILMARHLLERTSLAVGTIALDTGFYDQSHFTRIFTRQTGLAPLVYRKKFTTVS
jgi:AraC-like DNA-binding protein